MRLMICFLYFLIVSTNAHSYVYSLYGNSLIDVDAPTHVFIVGYPGKLDDLFLRTAHTKLLKYHRIYPNQQKVLLLARGKRSEQKRFTNYLKSKKYKILYSNNNKITTSSIYERLKNVKKIISLNIVTHSAAEMGVGLEKGGIRMNYKDGHMKKLVSNFTEETYVVIHGCNSGFIIAPGMSESWGVPVFGSLTSTDFQKLHSNGNWYFNNSGQHPRGQWATNCHTKGGCVRMKPDNHPYSGYWGKYHVGLPFMRPFCSEQISSERCLKARYKDLLAFPSGAELSQASTKEEIRKVAFDYLCPRNKRSSDYVRCTEKLRQSEVDSSVISFPFNGLELACTKENCSWRMKRERHHRVRVPIFYQVKVSQNGQIIEEYKKILKAFDQFN